MISPKIIFMGTPEFSVPSLEILLKNNYEVSAVVTTPDKPKGRGLKVESSAIKQFAISNNLKIYQPEKIKEPGFIEIIKNLSPDIIVVVAFRILPKEIFTIPRLGSFNLHASLLPKYRGAAPINWAIINGETETGVTTFFLEEKVDTGEIIFQEKIPIGSEDTAGDIHDKLMTLGAELVLKTVESISSGNVKVEKQEDNLSSPAPKIHKDDCRIRWDRNSFETHNFIRGLSPYPAAFTKHNDKIIKIFRSKIAQEFPKDSPGKIINTGSDLIVHTADSALKILEIQLEGRKKMNISEFLRGYILNHGDFFK